MLLPPVTLLSRHRIHLGLLSPAISRTFPPHQALARATKACPTSFPAQDRGPCPFLFPSTFRHIPLMPEDTWGSQAESLPHHKPEKPFLPDSGLVVVHPEDEQTLLLPPEPQWHSASLPLLVSHSSEMP